MFINMFNCVSYDTLCQGCNKTMPPIALSGHFKGDLVNDRMSYPVILTRPFKLNERSMVSAPSKQKLEDYMQGFLGIRSPRVYEAHIGPLEGADHFEVWFMIDFPREMAWMSADTQPLGSKHPLGCKENKVLRIIAGLLEDVADVPVMSWTIRIPLPEKCMNRQRLWFFEGLLPHVEWSLLYKPWKC
ncbi:uncharacterized protein BDV17DRAFT_289876 [Aspergillus undulatus]|uniref:uncharacterized protein n=1 Tax=Aspergillus undulatus TaxID=1810928 RepID=UPI003CCD36C7